MKKIISLILLLFQSSVFSYELEYARVFNKVIAESNELTFNLKADGDMTLVIPSFSTSPAQIYRTQNLAKASSLDLLIDELLKEKTNTLVRKLSLIKSNESQARFYSSEVDRFTLSISKDGVLLKQFELYNVEELRHYYEKLGEWQPLVDLIDNIQSMVAEGKKSHRMGEKQ